MTRNLARVHALLDPSFLLCLFDRREKIKSPPSDALFPCPFSSSARAWHPIVHIPLDPSEKAERFLDKRPAPDTYIPSARVLAGLLLPEHPQYSHFCTPPRLNSAGFKAQKRTYSTGAPLSTQHYYHLRDRPPSSRTLFSPLSPPPPPPPPPPNHHNTTTPQPQTNSLLRHPPRSVAHLTPPHHINNPESGDRQPPT